MPSSILIKKRDVIAMFPVSVPTLDRYIKAGIFPAPIKFGPRGVRWFEHEVRAWIEARKQERDRPIHKELAPANSRPVEAA
jgi:prophage regulatory protein